VKGPNFWCVEPSIIVVRISRLVAFLLAVVVCPLVLQACGRHGHGAPPKQKPDDPGFYDFTTARVTSLAEFRQLAAVPPGVDDRPVVAGAKFVITHFSEPTQRRLRFLDGRYYKFHDEWAWFRLLNGQPVSGMDAMERLGRRARRRLADGVGDNGRAPVRAPLLRSQLGREGARSRRRYLDPRRSARQSSRNVGLRGRL
jgi:hypothetical protein